MSEIKVIFDPGNGRAEEKPDAQKHEDIAMPLTNPGPDETNSTDESVNRADVQQTLIYGIQCPIICINGLVVSVKDIISFELFDNSHIPTMSCHVYDNKNLIQQILPPSIGNIDVIVQIIPSHDKYKKIDLKFILTDYSVGLNNDLYLSAKYFLPDFTNKNFKSLGELSLYGLCDKLAKETGLGLASNTKDKEDKRYVFCSFTSYQDTLDQEVNNSGEERVIYDWWIDPWHYLVLEDLYERYTATDELRDEDINDGTNVNNLTGWVWIANQMNDITSGTEVIPYLAKPELTNRFGMENSQLFIKNYKIINNIRADIKYGTDKVYSVYSMKDKECTDTLFVDKDVPKNQVIQNFEYKGEVYGEYDYITNSLYHIPFIQKMKKEILEVDLQFPLLGLTRGSQVVVAIYENSDEIDAVHNRMEEDSIIASYIDTIPVGDPTDVILSEEASQDGNSHFKLDKTISTQYLVIGNVYRYSKDGWTHTLELVRPDERRIKLLPEEE